MTTRLRDVAMKESVLIVAFDGILFDSLYPRARALAASMSADGPAVTADELLSVMPGRSIEEAAIEAVHQIAGWQATDVARDATQCELIALRAQRQYSEVVNHGVPLCAGVAQDMANVLNAGLRIVVRSDGVRRDVEPLLQLAGLEDLVMFSRCADDVPRPIGMTTLMSSYQAIADRLERRAIGREQRVAIEASAFAAETAATVVSRSVRSLLEVEFHDVSR